MNVRTFLMDTVIKGGTIVALDSARIVERILGDDLNDNMKASLIRAVTYELGDQIVDYYRGQTPALLTGNPVFGTLDSYLFTAGTVYAAGELSVTAAVAEQLGNLPGPDIVKLGLLNGAMVTLADALQYTFRASGNETLIKLANPLTYLSNLVGVSSGSSSGTVTNNVY